MSSFWDSSAIVPLFVPEPATDFARGELQSGVPVVWWSTLAEVASGIVRSGGCQVEELQITLLQLQSLKAEWREIEPSERVRELALEHLQRFDLRAADALQLGAALVWCSERPRGRRFICNDRKLSDAARQLGFDVVSFY